MDGLDREGMVKERSLLLPSLSTISCKTKHREEKTGGLCHRMSSDFKVHYFTQFNKHLVTLAAFNKCRNLEADPGLRRASALTGRQWVGGGRQLGWYMLLTRTG